MPFFSRASREWQHIPGAGGAIKLRQYDAQGELVQDSAYFDIEVYTLMHLFKNKVTTHSGINGGTSRTRTGGDWNFQAILSAPSHNFVEMLMGHYRGVGITFFMGDPLYWEGLGAPMLSYRADKALLKSVKIINDGHTGEDVVMAQVTGEGSSLLWGYVGDTPISPSLWP